MSAMSSPKWPCCFSGPGAETQLRPRCYLYFDQNCLCGQQTWGLVPKVFHVGQNLIVLRAQYWREWSCKALYGSHMRLFTSLLILLLRGSTTWLATCQGRKGQRRVQTSWRAIWKVRGFKIPWPTVRYGREGHFGGEVPPYNFLLAATWGFPPWRSSVPGSLFLLCLCLSNCLLSSMRASVSNY